MVEIVAQDGAANGLQFRGDLDGPDRVLGLDRHRLDVVLNPPKLPHAESGERGAEQDQRAETTIKPAANPQIEERHEQSLYELEV